MQPSVNLKVMMLAVGAWSACACSRTHTQAAKPVSTSQKGIVSPSHEKAPETPLATNANKASESPEVTSSDDQPDGPDLGWDIRKPWEAAETQEEHNRAITLERHQLGTIGTLIFGAEACEQNERRPLLTLVRPDGLSLTFAAPVNFGCQFKRRQGVWTGQVPFEECCSSTTVAGVDVKQLAESAYSIIYSGTNGYEDVYHWASIFIADAEGLWRVWECVPQGHGSNCFAEFQGNEGAVRIVTHSEHRSPYGVAPTRPDHLTWNHLVFDFKGRTTKEDEQPVLVAALWEGVDAEKGQNYLRGILADCGIPGRPVVLERGPPVAFEPTRLVGGYASVNRAKAAAFAQMAADCTGHEVKVVTSNGN